MKRVGRPHLRIVWDQDAMLRNVRAYREPVQLSFQLGGNENLIAFIGESGLSGSLLSQRLRTLKPRYLLDLRTCPRFDLLGYSRKKAFSDFHCWGTEYFCLSTEEAKGEIADRARKLIAKLGQEKCLTGPLIVIIETEAAVDQVYGAMPKPKVKSGEWSITVEGVVIRDSSTDCFRSS